MSVSPPETGDFQIILSCRNHRTRSPVPELFTEFVRGISAITDDIGRWVWQIVEQGISGWQFMHLSGRQCEGQCLAMLITNSYAVRSVIQDLTGPHWISPWALALSSRHPARRGISRSTDRKYHWLVSPAPKLNMLISKKTALRDGFFLRLSFHRRTHIGNR